MQLHDEIINSCAVTLRQRTAALCAVSQDPDVLEAAFFEEVTWWWRLVHDHGVTPTSVTALADCTLMVAACLPPSPRWEGVSGLARTARAATEPAAEQAGRALLTSLGVDPALTPWDAALADWRDMPTNCAGHSDHAVADVLIIHLRWALCVIADVDTPERHRALLAEAAHAGVTAVARRQAHTGDSAWDAIGLTGAAFADNSTGRLVAALAMTLEEIVTLSEVLP